VTSLVVEVASAKGGAPPRPAPRPALARFRPARPRGRLGAGLVAFAAAGLVAAPLLNLLRIALTGDGADWGHLLATVLPRAAIDTALLLAGIGALAGLIGVATAWLVTAYRFPGRNLLAWALALPLACPDLHRRLHRGRQPRLFRAGPERAPLPLRLDVALPVLVPGGPLASPAASR
jgi:hypothetical protein